MTGSYYEYRIIGVALKLPVAVCRYLTRINVPGMGDHQGNREP